MPETVYRAVIAFSRPGPRPARRPVEAKRVLQAIGDRSELDFRRCGLSITIADLEDVDDHRESVLLLLASLQDAPIGSPYRIATVGMRSAHPQYEAISIACACGDRVEVPGPVGELAAPHPATVVRLRLLAAMALVDGEVDEAERRLLRTITKTVGLAEDDLHAILTSHRSTLTRADLPRGRASRVQLLDMLVEMAMADGRLLETEIALARKLTRMLDLDESDLENAIRSHGVEERR